MNIKYAIKLGFIFLSTALAARAFAVDQFVIIPTAGDASATAVSADGLTVVGETQGQAFRWNQADGVALLGLGADGVASIARAVSADGSVVIGSYTDGAGLEQPFRWTERGGLISIRPNVSGAGGFAADVSEDGAIVVGEFGVPATGTNCGVF